MGRDLGGKIVDGAASTTDIRNAFFEVVEATPNRQVAYRDLWSELIRRGWTIRGGTPKRQQDAVYSALKGDARIEKVQPGVFQPRAG